MMCSQTRVQHLRSEEIDSETHRTQILVGILSKRFEENSSILIAYVVGLPRNTCKVDQDSKSRIGSRRGSELKTCELLVS